MIYELPATTGFITFVSCKLVDVPATATQASRSGRTISGLHHYIDKHEATPLDLQHLGLRMQGQIRTCMGHGSTGESVTAVAISENPVSDLRLSGSRAFLSRANLQNALRLGGQ